MTRHSLFGSAPVDKRTFLIKSAAVVVSGVGFYTLLPRKTTLMATNQETFPVQKTEAEWQAALSPEAFRVLRKHGTERAGTSALNKEYGKGIYKCAGCDQELFIADTKFDSGTGWPSFWQPIEGAIATTVDRSLFMTRTEVHCSRCGGHLGHVFNDGPKPTGLRYCMNGVSMEFVPS
jgi:peptide-methionine (R)-S-oxide reductase